jgi:hypothetical protein
VQSHPSFVAAQSDVLNLRIIVILNLFQDNTQRWLVILKQVQDDEMKVIQLLRATLVV